MKSFLLWLAYRFFYACARNINSRVESGPSLVIAPHPDDETLGCGGTIARARVAEQKVRLVFVTDGAAAGKSSKIAPEKLAQIRRDEANIAALKLGLNPSDVVFLDFPDTKAKLHINEIQEALRLQIVTFKPQQIYAPYGVDLNPDHVAIAEAVDRLVEAGSIPCPVYEYPVWFTPEAMVQHAMSLTILKQLRCHDAQAFESVKRDALKAHRSQCENITGEEGWFALTPSFVERFFYGFELFFEKPTTKD